MILTKEQISKAKKQFRFQRYRAIHQRNIEFKLSFDEWINWWIQTGHYFERGKGRGKYVMSRFNDEGPYSLDNIFCQLDTENIAEGSKKLIGIKRSDEFKRNLSIKFSGIKKPNQAGALNRFHKENLTDELKQKILEGRQKTKKPIMTPDGMFESLTEAAIHFDVDKGTIGYRLKTKSSEWYYIDKTKVQSN